MAVSKTRTSRALPLALAAVLVTLGAGCGNSGSEPAASTSSQTPPSPTVSPSSATTSQDPKEAAAANAAVTAYLGYVQAFAAASQIPDPEYPALARFAADPLLSLSRHNVRLLKTNGQVQLGAQTATVTSTSVDLESKPPVVTIHACLDYSALRLVFKASQSPVPNSQITTPKVSAIVTAWRYVNGQWMVNEAKDGTTPC